MEHPKLLIADEPTPGLDARAAGRILGHFRELAEEGAGVLLITHDLELALTSPTGCWSSMPGRPSRRRTPPTFQREETPPPLHPALWGALPQNGFRPIPGTQPYPGEIPDGCQFAPRCPHCQERCRSGGPVPYVPQAGGMVRCYTPEGGDTP